MRDVAQELDIDRSVARFFEKVWDVQDKWRILVFFLYRKWRFGASDDPARRQQVQLRLQLDVAEADAALALFDLADQPFFDVERQQRGD